MDRELRVQDLEERLEESERRFAKLQESTDRLKSENEELKNEVHAYKELIHSSPSMITLLKGRDLVIQTANKPILDFWGKDESVLGKPLTQVHAEIREQGLEQLLLNVLESGNPEYGYEMPVYIHRENKKEVSYFNFVYQPQRNRSNEIEGVAVIAQEVTPKAIYHERIKESEFKYRELIHSSNSLIAILRGKDMVIEIANEAIKNVWGKGEDVTGKALFEVLPEMVGQGMPEIFEEVYNTGKPFFAQERPLMHEQNGELKLGFFDFVYQPQKNIQGEVDGVAIIAQDVTHQGLLNKKIRESEKEFRELVNFMPHKISMSNAEGEPVFYNNSWKSYTGKTIQQLLENSWYNLIHPEDRERAQKVVDSNMPAGEDIEMELRIFDKNGVAKWHLARATAIKNEEGVINSWVSSCTEIQKLKEEEERKEGFLKLVSHELKTPVTSIKGYIQLLQAQLPDDETLSNRGLPVRSYLDRMEIQVERLIRLIAEMLDLSRIEQNELELKTEEFNLNQHVKEIVEDLKYSIKDIDIKLTNDFNCNIVADKDRIGQVIINFITNAYKYSPEGNQVDIKVSRDIEGFASVSVKDYGIGIQERELNQIFKKFYRVAGNRDETYAGFGIGLFLSNDIINRHNGKISVKSEVGKGSEFTFTLPLKQF